TGAPAALAPEGPSTPNSTVDELRRELVFVDPRVNDWQRLVADVTGGVDATRHLELILLDPTADGVSQVLRALAAQPGPVAALHFITHGTDGAVELGNAWFDAGNVNGYATALNDWRGYI